MSDGTGHFGANSVGANMTVGCTPEAEVYMEPFPEDSKAVSACVGTAHRAGNREAWHTLRRSKGWRKWIVTSFDQAYFDLGITLLSGLFNDEQGNIPKLVYDIGLTAAQREFLLGLRSVYVVTPPWIDYNVPNWFLSPKNYVFKLLIMEHVRHIISDNDSVLWIDAGVYPAKGIDEIFSLIHSTGAFFVDHDDTAAWPIFNMTFTSDACVRSMHATVEEVAAHHVCSCLMGFRAGARFQRIFSDAFAASLDPDASLGDKHPAPAERILGKGKQDRIAFHQAVLGGPKNTKPIDIKELRATFGYAGHRQDQSIISLLVARYRAPVYSAKKYCLGDAASSTASNLNHLSGGLSTEIEVKPITKETKFHSNTVHHRGTLRGFDFLEFKKSNNIRSIIFDVDITPDTAELLRFGNADIFGLDSACIWAYELKLFPKYYVCLELSIDNLKKYFLSKLISESKELGIKSFLLRGDVIKSLGLVGEAPNIVDFDAFRGGFTPWRVDPVTQGGHACAWASLLGYKEIYFVARGQGAKGYYSGLDLVADTGRVLNAKSIEHKGKRWSAVVEAIDPLRSHVVSISVGDRISKGGDCFDARASSAAMVGDPAAN